MPDTFGVADKRHRRFSPFWIGLLVGSVFVALVFMTT
jgi:hypothetical protein